MHIVNLGLSPDFFNLTEQRIGAVELSVGLHVGADRLDNYPRSIKIFDSGNDSLPENIPRELGIQRDRTIGRTDIFTLASRVL